jgi:hypothetical protein
MQYYVVTEGRANRLDLLQLRDRSTYGLDWMVFYASSAADGIRQWEQLKAGTHLRQDELKDQVMKYRAPPGVTRPHGRWMRPRRRGGGSRRVVGRPARERGLDAIRRLERRRAGTAAIRPDGGNIVEKAATHKREDGQEASLEEGAATIKARPHRAGGGIIAVCPIAAAGDSPSTCSEISHRCRVASA